MLGCALRRLQRLDEAISALREATRCDADFDEAWANLASCLIDCESPDAIACARRAVALDTDCSFNHYTLGRSLFVLATGSEREALAHLQTAADLDPEEAWCWIYLGWVHEHLGDPEAAAAAFERAAAIDPLEVEPLIGVGRIRRKQRRLDESLHYLRIARQLESSNAEVLYELGLSTLLHGVHGEAVHLLKQAAELDATRYAESVRRIVGERASRED